MQLKQSTTCDSRVSESRMWLACFHHTLLSHVVLCFSCMLPCCSAVGNSPLILDESPFRQIRQYLEPQFVVQTFDEFSEMDIRPKLGVSCRRLMLLHFSSVFRMLYFVLVACHPGSEQHRFRAKWIITSHYLQSTREYSNLGYEMCYITQIWVLTCTL
jgi:hypothetical protein